jgi:hypothetical protein
MAPFAKLDQVPIIDHLVNVENALLDTATELALLGNPDGAATLVKLNREHGVTHDQAPFRLGALCLAFAEARLSEDDHGIGAEEVARAIDWARSEACWLERENQQDEAFSAVDAALQEIEEPHDGSSRHRAIDESKMLVQGLVESLRDTQLPHVDTDSKNNATSSFPLPDPNDASARLIRAITSRWAAKDQLRRLAQAEALWPLYHRRGILLSGFALSRADIQAKATQAHQLFSTRLRHGRQNPHVGKSITALVDIANANTIAGRRTDPDLDDEQRQDTTPLTHAGASAAAITALESRLHAALPADYTAFLQYSDGLRSSTTQSGGSGVFNGSYGDPYLYGTSTRLDPDDPTIYPPSPDGHGIRWVDDENTAHTTLRLLPDLPLEIEDLVLAPAEMELSRQEKEVRKKTIFPRVRRVLLVAQEDVETLCFAPPRMVRMAVKAYLSMWERGNAEQRRILEMHVTDFCGGINVLRAWLALRTASIAEDGAVGEELDGDELVGQWCFIKDVDVEAHVYSDFTAYLEDMALASATRTL